MNIRTRVKVAGAVTLCVLVAYGALLLYFDRTMDHLTLEVKNNYAIVEKITVLSSLTQDFLLYHTERSQRQWSAAYAEVTSLLQRPEYQGLKSGFGTGDVPAKLKVVGDTFEKIMAIPADPGPDKIAGEMRNRLATQLLLASRDLLGQFLSLTEDTNRKLVNTQHFSSLVDLMALLVLGVLVISNIVFLQRSVVQPVLKLQAGTEIIGAGNLDHRVGIDSTDEIGQLSRAFDRMTGNLKELTRFPASLRKPPAVSHLPDPDGAGGGAGPPVPGAPRRPGAKPPGPENAAERPDQAVLPGSAHPPGA